MEIFCSHQRRWQQWRHDAQGLQKKVQEAAAEAQKVAEAVRDEVLVHEGEDKIIFSSISVQRD